MPVYRTGVLKSESKSYDNAINATSRYISSTCRARGVLIRLEKNVMTGTANQQRFETIQGVVERLTYHSPESGYSVARLKVIGDRDLVTIVGSFPNIQPGQTLQLTGFCQEHPKFGSQFYVTQYTETKPATITGIEKYLGSGLIKGVGPVTAKKIVAHFGWSTLDIIDTQIERLIEVPEN